MKLLLTKQPVLFAVRSIFYFFFLVLITVSFRLVFFFFWLLHQPPSHFRFLYLSWWTPFIDLLLPCNFLFIHIFGYFPASLPLLPLDIIAIHWPLSWPHPSPSPRIARSFLYISCLPWLRRDLTLGLPCDTSNPIVNNFYLFSFLTSRKRRSWVPRHSPFFIIFQDPKLPCRRLH